MMKWVHYGLHMSPPSPGLVHKNGGRSTDAARTRLDTFAKKSKRVDF